MKLQVIVVGYGGSPDSCRAIEAAMELVADSGVIHVVSAYEPLKWRELAELRESAPTELEGTPDALIGVKTHLHDAEELLGEQGINFEGHLVLEDDPADAILQIADDVAADLIIVGSRGFGRGTRFLRGSVSSRIASHATSSFLIVQHDFVSVDTEAGD